jgi:cytochrome P450
MTVSRASVADTARVFRDVFVPMVAQGVILRRPRVLALAERLDTDGRATRRIAALRNRYGNDPLLLRLPRRRVALVLDPHDVERILADTPEPFAAATEEKRAALRHFQPHGVLISTGAERAERRRFNEAVLETGRPLHQHAEQMTAVIRSEAAGLTKGGPIGWAEFELCWWRIVRRIVLGDSARDDTETTDLLRRLRADANWASLRPRRKRLQARLNTRLQRYLRQPEAGSLAAMAAAAPAARGTDPAGQIPHWLFAFDAAGIATWRTLALLAGHPDAQQTVREETAAELPFTRACVLEAVRLWPTTLAVLRDSTETTRWDNTEVPAGTAFVIVSAAFHRDPCRFDYADVLTPRIWLDGQGDKEFFPFSAGPARCPGRDVVLHTTATLVSHLARGDDITAEPGRLAPGGTLPGTLDHTNLRLTFAGR